MSITHRALATCLENLVELDRSALKQIRCEILRFE